MKNTITAAAIAMAFAASAQLSPAADSAAEQLATVTSAMNSIPDIIFYKDTDGVYRGGNTAWAALLGKPLDQLVGKTDLDLFPEEMAKSFQSYDKAMLAGGQATRNEEWLVYPDGRKVYVETLKTPWVGQDGKVLGVLGVCHEIEADSAKTP
jgi:PAS domain S-box-containing protein